VRSIAIGVIMLMAGISHRALAQAPDGKALYEANCKKCHGVLGNPPKAIKEQFPKVATFDGPFIATHTEDSIVTIMTRGKGEDMKSFKGKLTHAEMAAIAAYVHALATRPRP